MDEALKIFYIEASELLDEMESSLIRLDRSHDDTDAIDSIFRAAHTLKGSSGIVGLDVIEGFTHKVENLLELIRSGSLSVDSRIIELFFECRDHINSMVAGIAQETTLPEVVAFEGLRLSEELDKLSGTLDSGSSAEDQQFEGSWHISLRFSPDTLRNGMDPVSFLSYLETFGEITYLRTLLESMPPAEDMDPESCYLGFEAAFWSRTTASQIEDVFEFLEDDCQVRIIPPGSPVQSYLDLISKLPENDSLLRLILIESGSLSEADLAACLASDAQEPSGARKQEDASLKSSTIRVDVAKLDILVNTVGELVISGAAIKEEAERHQNRHLSNLTDNLLRLIDEVRERSMSVRMTPLWDTFNRFNRTVRDMCHESGKNIELRISGGETELDRTVIERIKDPLMHLIRNSIDHGIETPSERLAKGKPQKGEILLRAYQKTGFIVIEVSDNGRGLDEELIFRRARERGLIGQNERPLPEQAISLIFEPGFSTVEEVTNISGRGMGMDVVRRNIEELKGSVEVSSLPGQGTTFKVHLPLTLAIIDGFLVTVGGKFFVVPMDMVLECLELTGEDRRAAHGRDHIALRGHILPYLRLRKIFDITDEVPEHEHILVVRYGDRAVGLLVDSLVGETSTVIKSLGKYYRDVQGISGATIMGDGSVALIVDVPALVGSVSVSGV
jgi:two-component system chemotaxis sensor kinase CheA